MRWVTFVAIVDVSLAFEEIMRYCLDRSVLVDDGDSWRIPNFPEDNMGLNPVIPSKGHDRMRMTSCVTSNLRTMVTIWRASHAKNDKV